MFRLRILLFLFLINYIVANELEKEETIKKAILKALSEQSDLDFDELKDSQKFFLIKSLFFHLNKGPGANKPNKEENTKKFYVQTSNLFSVNQINRQKVFK